MDAKVGFVVESIRKLLALKVSDEEIINELKGVGISKEEAIELIKNARVSQEDQQEVKVEEKKVDSSPLIKSSKDVFVETTSQLSMDDQIVTQLGIDTKQTKKVSPVGEVNAHEKKVIVDGISANEVDFGVSAKDDNSSDNLDLSKSIETSSKESEDIQREDGFPKFEPAIKVKDNSISSNIEKNIPKVDVSSSNVSSSNVSSNNSAESVSQSKKHDSFSNDADLFSSQLSIKSSKVTSTPPTSIDSTSSKNSSTSTASSSSAFSSKLGELSSKFSSQNSFSSNDSKDVDELWKKGIVVAVNSKLSEMKKLKDEIDVNISDKVDSSVKKEVAQLRVLLDSQKELLISSNKASLDEKQREITFIIDSKIAELKQYNKQLSENLSALESAKNEQKLALQQVQQALDNAKKTKSQLLIEMNAELIKSKSSAQAFLDNADKHLKDLDDRVNRTLELEKNIADGMLAQAEQKIENLTIQKADDLMNELEVRLNKLKAAEASINPEVLQQKIQMLDDFKKQFINTMKDNITQINSAIAELNEKNSLLDRQIQEKILTIDAKIEELTKFEKEFTLIIETALKK